MKITLQNNSTTVQRKNDFKMKVNGFFNYF